MISSQNCFVLLGKREALGRMRPTRPIRGLVVCNRSQAPVPAPPPDALTISRFYAHKNSSRPSPLNLPSHSVSLRVEDVPERLQISVKVQLNRPTMEFCVQIIVSCHVCEICYNIFLRDSLLSLIALKKSATFLGHRQVIHLTPRRFLEHGRGQVQ